MSRVIYTVEQLHDICRRLPRDLFDRIRTYTVGMCLNPGFYCDVCKELCVPGLHEYCKDDLTLFGDFAPPPEWLELKRRSYGRFYTRCGFCKWRIRRGMIPDPTLATARVE